MTYECSASFHSSYRRSHISILLHLIPLDRIYHKVHSVRVDEYPGMTSTRKVMEMSIHDFDDTLLAVWYRFYSILHKLLWEHSIGLLFACTISMIFEGYIYTSRRLVVYFWIPSKLHFSKSSCPFRSRSRSAEFSTLQITAEDHERTAIAHVLLGRCLYNEHCCCTHRCHHSNLEHQKRGRFIPQMPSLTLDEKMKLPKWPSFLQ